MALSKKILPWAASFIVSAALLPSVALAQSTPAQAQASVKTVYHLNEGLEQASRAMGNIRNHLNADPSAKITVVTHGRGIDFLLAGAKDVNGNAYEVAVQTLKGQGVQFAVCNNTLVTRKIDPKQVIDEASIVPSGVAEVARLQAREGFVYLRP